MIRKCMASCVFFSCMLLIFFAGCTDSRMQLLESYSKDINSRMQLQESLVKYSEVISDNPQDDLRLTIYYMSPYVLTRKALSTTDLINHSYSKKIFVEKEALIEQLDLFRKLDATTLNPAQDHTYLNARLYYILEYGSEVLLEVAVSQKSHNSYVNGIEIEDSTILYELITPFLTDEALDMGWGAVGQSSGTEKLGQGDGSLPCGSE